MNDTHWTKFEAFLAVHKRFTWEQIMNHPLTRKTNTVRLYTWLNNYSDVGHLIDHGSSGWSRNCSR